MHPLLERLHQDHINLNRLLGLLERETLLLERGANPDYYLMLDMLDYMRRYPDEVHHPCEDVIFEAYLERFREGAEIIEHLRSEHQVLVEDTQELRYCVERIVQGSICSREDFQTALAGYLARQREHLNREEAEVFRLIDAALGAEDWHRLEPLLPASTDPLFGGPVAERFASLYSHLLAMTGHRV
jgi:hemerythrin-like domain-containing protein